MIKQLSWIMIFLCTLTFNQLAFSDTSLCRDNIDKMVQSLKLEDSQKAKIKPILTQLKTDIKTAADQMSGLEDQITTQVNSDSMDQDKVNSLVDKKAGLIGDMMKAKVKAKNQIYAILTSDQKSKLQSMVKKVEEKIVNEFKNCQ